MIKSFINPYIIQSYFYCYNKVYIEKNKMFLPEHENIHIGKIYDLDNNKIKFENFEIDGIDLKNKFILEYKKTSSNIEGSKFQLLYYLYLLEELYIGFLGKLICIEDKTEYIVNLDNNTRIRLLNILGDINNINCFDISLLENKKCQKCGYYDYCHV